jgi:predicted outer membrane repeat protein
MKLFATILTFVLTLAISSPSIGSIVWYVAPAPVGDNWLGDGSMANPLATVQAALLRAQPTEYVELLPGTYTEFDIDLRSGVTVRSSTGIPEDVIIDAGLRGKVFQCADVEDVVFEGMTLMGASHGAIKCRYASITVRNCVFEDNVIHTHGGGALTCHFSDAILEDCSFNGNAARYFGGAIFADESSVVVDRCDFHGNAADSNGGGACLWRSIGSFNGCWFHSNKANDGAGLYCKSSTLDVAGSVFFRNSAAGTAGAITCYRTPSTIMSCTFCDNEGYLAGAMNFWGNSPAMITNTIVAFSGRGTGIRCLGPMDVPTLVCCDIFGNTNGDWVGSFADQAAMNDNFSADPLFCNRWDGDLHLHPGSPCDHATCGLIGALPVGCTPSPASLLDVAGDGAATSALTFHLAPNVPNPFNPATEIGYSIPAGSEASRVTLTVYNALGQRIRTLVDAEQSAGAHAAVWDGMDEGGHSAASGVYFYRITWNGRSETKRMVLLK